MLPIKFNYSCIFVAYVGFTFTYIRFYKKVCKMQNCETIKKRVKPAHDH